MKRTLVAGVAAGAAAGLAMAAVEMIYGWASGAGPPRRYKRAADARAACREGRAVPSTSRQMRVFREAFK
jgi:hypothetical protein